MKVQDKEEKKYEDDEDMKFSYEDINGSNDDEEEDRPKKTKEEMPKRST